MVMKILLETQPWRFLIESVSSMQRGSILSLTSASPSDSLLTSSSLFNLVALATFVCENKDILMNEKKYPNEKKHHDGDDDDK